MCGVFPDIFTNPTATCASLEVAGYSTEPSNLNIPSIGIAEVAGTRTVERTITNVSDRRLDLKAKADAPKGYVVEFSPARVTLKPGESTTVQVTVTNRSAPVGEWRFGAITWKGTGYDARIPLAVAGTPIKAPAEVSHTGESGSGSVDVDFGYTGDFSANAYGLADEALTTDSVGQDETPAPPASPVFSPEDLGKGATAHEFDLTNVKFWRLTLDEDDLTDPPDGTDIDIFVYGPDGKEVASSTAGGTDEIIDLHNPAPGTYTVYVHGWQTGGESVEYTAHTWTVSDATNGTLLVTSAPASATVGTTGTVEYSWSDVAAESTEIGLLIYSDGSGEIGRTLVSVDN
ncbi:MAG: hypothetical protein LC679_13495 [Intrasporangiaceae bacterium]|nr:hypothetical protein [Intrasporangiaceae bacterium]